MNRQMAIQDKAATCLPPLSNQAKPDELADAALARELTQDGTGCHRRVQ